MFFWKTSSNTISFLTLAMWSLVPSRTQHSIKLYGVPPRSLFFVNERLHIAKKKLTLGIVYKQVHGILHLFHAISKLYRLKYKLFLVYYKLNVLINFPRELALYKLFRWPTPRDIKKPPHTSQNGEWELGVMVRIIKKFALLFCQRINYKNLSYSFNYMH